MKFKIILAALSLSATLSAASETIVDLSVDQCRQMALESNEDIRSADLEMKKADLDRQIANTARLPKFDATATGVYMLPDIDMTIADLQMRGTYMAGINLTQPIYTGGKITAARKLTQIGHEAARQNMRKSRADVIAEADRAYWTYLSVCRKVTMLESYQSMIDSVYSITATSVSVGLKMESELLRIDTRRSEIEYQLQKARNGADLCRMSLCRVTGLPFDVNFNLTDTIASLSAPGVLDPDISARPELALLVADISAKEQQIKSARADFLPVVALSLGYTYMGNLKLKGSMPDAEGNYTTFSDTYNRGTAMAMLSVSIPIFHWGEGMKKVKKAKIEAQQSQLQLEKSRRYLEIEANQAAKNLQDGYRMVETALKGLRQADENLLIMRSRYESSLAPLTDMLQAQTQWQQASSDLIEAQAQFKIYETDYLKATGRLD